MDGSLGVLAQVKRVQQDRGIIPGNVHGSGAWLALAAVQWISDTEHLGSRILRTKDKDVGDSYKPSRDHSWSPTTGIRYPSERGWR